MSKEIKFGKYTLYVEVEYNSGLFDRDENGNFSKVLKLFGRNSKGEDTLNFARFDYSAKGKYRLATEEDLVKYGCEYFTENGERPFKRKICGGSCEFVEECFMTDDKFEKYKSNLEETEVYKCDEFYENGIPQ